MTTEQVRQANKSDLTEIVELLMAVFGTGGRWTPAAFHNFYFGDSTYTPDQSFVVEYGHHIVSHVRCSLRRMRVGEATVQVGAVSSVATLPGFRSRGYATLLLQRVIRLMEQRGDEVSMLFTAIPTFYQSLGWVSYPQYSLEKRLADRRRALRGWAASHASAAEASVRRVERGSDACRCRQLSGELNRALSLAAVRPAGWWDDAFPWSWDARTDWFLAALQQGTLTEYLRLFVSGSSALIMDWAPSTDDARLTGVLLHHCLVQCPAVKILTGSVPRDSRLACALRSLPGETREWESDGMMLRLVNRRRYLARLHSEIRRRQRSLPPGVWRGELLIESPSSEVAVLIPAPEHPPDSDPRRLTLRLTDRDLFLLTLGYTDADHVTGIRESWLPSSMMATLHHLFPSRPQVFWAIDQF